MTKKYEVHWEHLQRKEHNIHGEFDSFNEAMQSIREWWALNEFEPPYVRFWTLNNRTTIDYGPHYMFYYIHELAQK
ncbi:hypothetical protein [Listeria seeligeri]|uniref:hypothetical protein n=1 Tax=Listeria seeligeri TaxID=1640 RepID=UPI0022EAE392|nr:hypothetical protein [Listeria seeligeri]